MIDNHNTCRQTKIRLLEAAGEVFVEHGYRAATVREICRRARAHVGAVNYHFRDKKGLYAAVLEYSHKEIVKRYPPDMGLPDGACPEDRLRVFIRSFLMRILDESVPAWYGKLIAREMADPSHALEPVVRNSIRPLYEYLEQIILEIIGEFMGESKGKVAHSPEPGSDVPFLCAMSIVGQCLQHYNGRHIIAFLQPGCFHPGDIDRLTDAITRFSIGGIREYARQQPVSKKNDCQAL